MKVVRGDFAGSYKPYNSFKVEFMLQKSTIQNVELRVNLNIMAEFDAKLLQGSISENFPSFISAAGT